MAEKFPSSPPFFPRKQRAVRANPKGQLVTRGKGYRTLSVSTPSGGLLRAFPQG